MQHWAQDSDTASPTEAPADVWVAWLNRPPLHDVAPPPPRPRHWSGAAIAIGLAGFWIGLIALGWRALG